MGITKLMHIKERSKGRMNQGMINAIYYITNPEKTDNKTLIGGNCGVNEEKIIKQFMDTKAAFDKFDGRQAYHYVISFNPEDNVSAQLCYDIISDFVEEYLNNEHDVVFAVHTDKEHMHGHIIFNSVNAVTGKKYRYEEGDWERYIQPITDRIAEKYGLSRLEFVREEEPRDWKQIMSEDIAVCIRKSDSYEEFLKRLQQEHGYEVREGISKKNGYYLALKPPGKRKAVRSYNLPMELRPEQIKRRIGSKNKRITYVIARKVHFNRAFVKIPRRYMRYSQMGAFQRHELRKIYRARKLYGGNTNAPWENERAIRNINEMCRQWNYILCNNIESLEDVEGLEKGLKERIRNENQEIKKIRKLYKSFLGGSPSQFEKIEMYGEMLKNPNEHVKELKQIENEMETGYIASMYKEYNELINEHEINRQKLRRQLKMAKYMLENFNFEEDKAETPKKEKERKNTRKREDKKR